MTMIGKKIVSKGSKKGSAKVSYHGKKSGMGC